MRVVLLGTAAGGGFPQWNCSCGLCAEVRAGSSRLSPRTQSGVAVSADGERWFLLNASPDLRAQIESFPPLQARAKPARNSPIQGVLLTNADLDHTLGLMQLREGRQLRVHCSPAVRENLTGGFPMAALLDSFCGIQWLNAPENLMPLLCHDNSPSGLLYNSFFVPGKQPRYMQGKALSVHGHSVGYKIADERTGGRLVFVPDIAAIEPGLVPRLSDCNLLLFDGTFWSQHEMHERCGIDISAGQMGHIPVSGEGGSLKILAGLPAKNRIYIHINNTNPILLEDSPERAAVVAAGVQIGRDGMEFNL
jgi:pyrroloquinoline quinone biosynthesis protein B